MLGQSFSKDRSIVCISQAMTYPQTATLQAFRQPRVRGRDIPHQRCFGLRYRAFGVMRSREHADKLSTAVPSIQVGRRHRDLLTFFLISGRSGNYVKPFVVSECSARCGGERRW